MEAWIGEMRGDECPSIEPEFEIDSLEFSVGGLEPLTLRELISTTFLLMFLETVENYASVSDTCCSTNELMPDSRDSSLTMRSLRATSLMDSIWNLGNRARPVTSTRSFGRFCNSVKVAASVNCSVTKKECC